MSKTQLLTEEISPVESDNRGAEGKGETENSNVEDALLQRLAVRRQSLQKKLAESDSIQIAPLETTQKQNSKSNHYSCPNLCTYTVAESKIGSDLHDRLKQRLLAMRERASESLPEGEGVSVEPERVLKGKRGEPSGLNRFQQLAAQSRGSPTGTGRKEEVEMSVISKRKEHIF